MTYSYTQISHFLTCPRRYRYRYLDGWQEKDNRTNLLFGRAFEKAIAAYFLREDCNESFFTEWSKVRGIGIHFGACDSWEGMLRAGLQLLQLFVQDDRVRVPRPRQNLQRKIVRPISSTNNFVAYLDAIGQLDATRCIIDWKTTAARYSDDVTGMLDLDPQLLCYSWITGEPNVAFVVFVRKRLPEIQYLRTSISDEQRSQFGQLVAETIQKIEGDAFLQHSGIRFPQNACLSCPFVGLCVGNQKLVDIKLKRRQGAECDWVDELAA